VHLIKVKQLHPQWDRANRPISEDTVTRKIINDYASNYIQHK